MAEDLAQDTLVEAWHHRHKVQQPAGWDAWLSAVARNVCLCWVSARRRERTFVLTPRAGEPSAIPDLIAGIPDPLDLEADLARAELATAVEDASALLPPETRAALVERYIHGAPQATVALQLGLSESAVEARLHRGKRALRRTVANALRADAAPHG